MPATILAIGTALPANSFAQSETLNLAKSLCCTTSRQERFLEELYKQSGVSRRSSVLQKIDQSNREGNFFSPPRTIYDTGPTTAERMQFYEQQAAPLATTACQAAFQKAAISPNEITHLITVSCTGFAAPGFDLELFKTIPLKPTTKRTHIGFMGCHGALNALRAADAFCAENPDNTVLVCATELCSMHFQYGWARERVVSNALFADGSAAVIVSKAARHQHLSKALAKINYSDAASYVVPQSENAMTWKIGDSGFVMNLASNVPDLIEENLPQFMHQWLAANNLEMQQIAGWAVHPGGPRILEAVRDCLALPAESLAVSRQILSECGNMSSPTVLFILDRLITVANATPCVVLGFGPGLTIEAALIR